MPTHLDNAPSILRAFFAAATSRKRADGVRPEDVVGDGVSLGPVPVDPAALAAYRDVCSLGTPGAPVAPASYAQLLVTPLHVHLVTAPTFPLPAMGLVHPRCVVHQRRAVREGEAITLTAGIAAGRAVPNGLVFELTAEARVGDELVWDSRAETFARTGRGAAPKRDEPAERWDSEVPFFAPSDAGRRYARVSGDANPVHLSALTARLFGYTRPIAHGWWLLARCLGELGAADADALHLDIELRRPVFLPSTLRFVTRAEDGATAFAVLDGDDKIRLVGRLRR